MVCATKPPVAGFEFSTLETSAFRATVIASGELDLAARDALAEVLESQRSSGRRAVRLDVSDVTFLDCSCLGVLVEAHELMLAAHGLLVLVGASPAMVRLLRMTGLYQILFTVQPEAGAALEESRKVGATTIPWTGRTPSLLAATEGADGLGL